MIGCHSRVDVGTDAFGELLYCVFEFVDFLVFGLQGFFVLAQFVFMELIVVLSFVRSVFHVSNFEFEFLVLLLRDEVVVSEGLSGLSEQLILFFGFSKLFLFLLMFAVAVFLVLLVFFICLSLESFVLVFPVDGLCDDVLVGVDQFFELLFGLDDSECPMRYMLSRSLDCYLRLLLGSLKACVFSMLVCR